MVCNYTITTICCSQFKYFCIFTRCISIIISIYSFTCSVTYSYIFISAYRLVDSQVESNNTIATICKGNSIYIITTCCVCITIPVVRITCNNCFFASNCAIWNSAVLYSQVQCYNAIATICCH